jgi:Domain of unknown function (DUF6456)
MKQMLAEGSLRDDANRCARAVTINRAESPLAWLRARGLVTARQYDAGDQLRRDYELANLSARVTMAWEAPTSTGTRRSAASPGQSTLKQIDAKARFDAALAAAGTGLSDILWRVVCAGEAMPVAEKSLGWPIRAGRLVLTIALDRLAEFYRVR